MDRVNHWQHPNRRPEPVSLRKFSFHLDPAIFDSGPRFGVDAARFDRVDDGASGDIGFGYAIAQGI
jgi:hypothetical protein